MSNPVSDNLGQVLDKMISGAVKRRYQSVIEVLQALNPPSIAPTIINPPQPVSVPTIPSSHPDNLSSEVRVDYTKLRDLLAARKWKKADDETYLVMLQVIGRKENDWIRNEEILNFSCTDLLTIDRLWVKYSNGRFGFSVQKKIYQEVGGKLDGKFDEEAWNKFGDRVGWSQGWMWGWIFKSHLSIPVGYFPGLFDCEAFWGEGFRWVIGGGASLLSHRDL